MFSKSFSIPKVLILLFTLVSTNAYCAKPTKAELIAYSKQVDGDIKKMVTDVLNEHKRIEEERVARELALKAIVEKERIKKRNRLIEVALFMAFGAVFIFGLSRLIRIGNGCPQKFNNKREEDIDKRLKKASTHEFKIVARLKPTKASDERKMMARLS